MALTRANAATYLVGQYGTGVDSLLVLANIGLTDVSGGLKEIIDDAFLGAGVAFPDLATATIADSDVGDGLALLRFVALRKILSNLNAAELRGDLKVGTLSLSGLTANVKDLLSLELADVQARGLVSSALSTNAAAFLGGIDVADVDTRSFDSGLVPPAFTRRLPRRWPERWGGWS